MSLRQQRYFVNMLKATGRLLATAWLALPSLCCGDDRESLRLDSSPVAEIECEDRSAAVSVVTSERILTVGDEVQLVISLANRGAHPLPVFNPHMSSLTGGYATLGLFDSHGRYLADLFDPPGAWLGWRGSLRMPEHADWCVIAPKEVYAIRRSFKVEHTFERESGLLRMEPAYGLKPGRYYVQLVVDRRFFSESPWGGPYYPCGINKASHEYAEWRSRHQKPAAEAPKPPDARSELFEAWAKEYPPGEILRSNVVAITLSLEPVEALKPGRVGQAKASRRLVLGGE